MKWLRLIRAWVNLGSYGKKQISWEAETIIKAWQGFSGGRGREIKESVESYMCLEKAGSQLGRAPNAQSWDNLNKINNDNADLQPTE